MLNERTKWVINFIYIESQSDKNVGSRLTKYEVRQVNQTFYAYSKR